LADLGSRAMSHDESMHALSAFRLLTTGTYRHDPAYHGPLLYYINALAYWLVGASDTTARLGPALAGIGIVVVLYLFRCYLGRLGAWLAALFVVISPTMLFYSRYLREDIYLALFSLLWVYGVFRYLDSRHRHWLLLVTIAMALSFLSKEAAFIVGAIVGAFCAALLLQALRQDPLGWRESAAGDLAVLMATLALPFMASIAHGLLGWNASDSTSARGLAHSAVLVVLLFAASTLVAKWWFRSQPETVTHEDRPRFFDWVRLMTVFSGLQALFFTAFFTNVPGGLASGIVGSLGYWLSQHTVGRGGQPWFYYLLLGGIYEFLPLFLGVISSVVLLRGLRTGGPSPVPESDRSRAVLSGAASKDAGGLDRRTFLAFCVWWVMASWVAYAMAGEKMPWLLLHQVLPLCLLAGWWTGRLLTTIVRTTTGWRGPIIVMVGVPTLLGIALRLSQTKKLGVRELTALTATTSWILQFLLAIVVAVLVVRQLKILGWPSGRRLALAGLAAFAAVLTVRSAVQLAYVNYDLATELLVYAHGTPDIKRALAEIELISERTTGGYNLEVAYDDESTWPLAWYLREYPKTRFYGTDPTPDAMAAPVIIVGPKNAAKVWPFVERGYVKREYRLIWWPIQDYATLSWGGLGRALTDLPTRERLWEILHYRRYPGLDLAEWPNRRGFTMYVSRDVAQRVWPLGLDPSLASQSTGPGSATPKLSWPLLETYAGAYGGVSLRAPTALAVAPDGARIIADSGNDRIVVLNRDGTFRLAFGSSCTLSQGRAGGCLDLDGPGPREFGDGQFHEPWGVAISPSGEIYIADTWNGRIQVFDAHGQFLAKWGRFGQAGSVDPTADPHVLYGPRGVAFDGRGELLVSDTGNKRLLRFGPKGEPLSQTGGAGAILGRFAEPVGLAVDHPNGSVYVADAWNRRIQRLDRELRAVAEWPVPSWESRRALDKPYLAADDAGRIYASDPAHSRILVYSQAGQVEGSLRIDAGSRPLGVALDLVNHTLLVADQANNRVLVFKIYEKAAISSLSLP
jgi:uncharacterized protein (TIGR03663 family)